MIHSRTRTATTLVALALAGGVAMAPAASAATSAQVGKGLTLSSYESRLLSLINNARAAAHLPKVKAEPGSTDVARRWSLHLASAGTLSHNPRLADNMSSDGCSAWLNLAENVGEGPADQPDALFDAYMASPLHRANILSRTARFVGVGTVQVTEGDAQVAWNTITFSDAYSPRYGKARTSATGTVQGAALPVLAGRWHVALRS